MVEFENENENTSEESAPVQDEVCDTPCDESVTNDATESGEPRFTASTVLVGSEGSDAVMNDEAVVAVAPKRTALTVFYDYVETFCYALALMMVLFLFVFRYVSVDGDSMLGTLHNKDKLIISNLFYTPKTGDIVVINPESHGSSEEPIIKRVIAVEGQTVRIDYENWAVYVDGVKLDEPYIEAMKTNSSMNRGSLGAKYETEVVVGEGKVFVMGDNRNNSKDSRDRAYGEMGINRILGRVIIRLTPNFGTVD